VVATLPLKTASSLEEVAHLCLVDPVSHAKFGLTMCKTAILTVLAFALLRKNLAEFRLL
jgi:hypothetical protein